MPSPPTSERQPGTSGDTWTTGRYPCPTGGITSAYTTLRPMDIGMSRYLFYLLYTFDIRKGFYGMGSGVRQGLNYDEVKEIRIVMPNDETQYAISDYLDKHCAQIDTLIDEAKNCLDEYRMWKASIIFEAVTKGTDSSADMVDSGIDIIGNMPSSWALKRLRFLCSVSTGNQDTQDSVADGAYPFYVRSPIVERSNKYTFEGESVLMAGDGAGAGKVFHHATGKYAIHQRVYCFYDFSEIDATYFFYYMSSMFSTEIDKGSAKSTVPSVRLPMLLNFPICLPPRYEQKHICEVVLGAVKSVDAIIEEKKALIANLESYKKSIIYEAVTGKRKVVLPHE